MHGDEAGQDDSRIDQCDQPAQEDDLADVRAVEAAHLILRPHQVEASVGRGMTPGNGHTPNVSAGLRAHQVISVACSVSSDARHRVIVAAQRLMSWGSGG